MIGVKRPYTRRYARAPNRDRSTWPYLAPPQALAGGYVLRARGVASKLLLLLPSRLLACFRSFLAAAMTACLTGAFGAAGLTPQPPTAVSPSSLAAASWAWRRELEESICAVGERLHELMPGCTYELPEGGPRACIRELKVLTNDEPYYSGDVHPSFAAAASALRIVYDTREMVPLVRFFSPWRFTRCVNCGDDYIVAESTKTNYPCIPHRFSEATFDEQSPNRWWLPCCGQSFVSTDRRELPRRNLRICSSQRYPPTWHSVWPSDPEEEFMNDASNGLPKATAGFPFYDRGGGSIGGGDLAGDFSCASIILAGQAARGGPWSVEEREEEGEEGEEGDSGATVRHHGCSM